MENQSKLYLLIFLLPFFCLTCEQKGNDLNYIEGEVENGIIDHVILKREGCRFKSIFFIISLNNNSRTDSLILNIIKPETCEYTIDNPNIWLISNDTTGLAVVNHPEGKFSRGTSTLILYHSVPMKEQVAKIGK